MKERYKVFIVDIDQLIDFSIFKTVDRFASITSDWSNFYYYWNFVKYHFQGNLNGQTAESFKEGGISSDDFVSFLREKIKLTSKIRSQEIKESWTASCRISEENLAKIVDFFKQAESRYSILISVSKDPLQYDEIVRQLDQRFALEDMPSLESNQNVILAKSFILGSAQEGCLVSKAISAHGLDVYGASLVPLSGKITSETVVIKKANIIYREENSPENWHVAFNRYLDEGIFPKEPIEARRFGPSTINLSEATPTNFRDIVSYRNSTNFSRRS